MNLISDPWLLVSTTGRRTQPVAPWQITAFRGEPVAALAGPRPEFNGAAIQFLIGLFQTAVAQLLPPLDVVKPSDWQRMFDQPPKPEELRAALKPLTPAFELLGDSPRFLQDSGLPTAASRLLSIEQLLLDSPGDNAIRLGKDHFVQQGLIRHLCQRCSACALLSHQLNASSGGAGYRVGIRGGGPLTTILMDRTSLWRTVWLNVLPWEDLGTLASDERHSLGATDAAIFPWMAPTKTSEKGRPPITLGDIDPLQMYWSMPRRVRLTTADQPAVCDVCGELSEAPIGGFHAQNYGCNYLDEFIHPLSPYWSMGSGPMLPFHARSAFTYYDDLLGYLFEDDEEASGKDNASGRVPARVVTHALATVCWNPEERCLWVFGFEMDKAKVRSWTDGTLPLILAGDGGQETQRLLENEIRKLILAARRAERYLTFAVKKTMKRRLQDARSNFDELRLQFWTMSAARFERTWCKVRDEIGDPVRLVDLRQQWLRDLTSMTMTIFLDQISLRTLTTVDSSRIATAEVELAKSLNGPKIRKVLDLPTEIRAPSRRRVA